MGLIAGVMALAIGVATQNSQATASQNAPDNHQFVGPFHVVSKPYLKVKSVVRLTHSAPSISVSNWGVLVGIPITSEGQANTHFELSLPDGSEPQWEQMYEDGPLDRTFAFVHIPARTADESHNFQLQVIYSATLNQRAMAPGPPSAPVPDLHPDIFRAYTERNRIYDYDSDAIKSFIAEQNLTRGKDEAEIQFAYRTLQVIARRYKPVGRKVIQSGSDVTHETTGAGGDLGALYVSVLRANGIPSRTLWGKIISFVNTPEDTLTHFNVRAEFFIKNTGWIPVDVFEAAGHADPSPWFGSDDGRLLVMHYDPLVFRGKVTALQLMQDSWGQQTGTWAGGTRKETQSDTVTILNPAETGLGSGSS